MPINLKIDEPGRHDKGEAVRGGGSDGHSMCQILFPISVTFPPLSLLGLSPVIETGQILSLPHFSSTNNNWAEISCLVFTSTLWIYLPPSHITGPTAPKFTPTNPTLIRRVTFVCF